MNNSPVIKIENVGKCYKLGALSPGYKSLGETLAHMFKKKEKRTIEHKWVLDKINFEVQQGEILGIIGKNGSGKSTLLKILSRITSPSAGMVHIEGRVGALLEVGTGFHPELTGRENIYMNGSIFGMTRKEIQEKFDSIVEFSGVNEFLDTPVKRYSSGMKVRLAFSVAAHIEPEILIIDEVLAVGDAEFQQKCLGRMQNVSTKGRTVLFVSHQMEMIQNLCERVVWLDEGKVKAIGDAKEIVQQYLKSISINSSQTLESMNVSRQGNGAIRVTSIKFFDASKKEVASLSTGQKMCIRLYYTAEQNVINDKKIEIRLGIRDLKNNLLLALRNDLTGDELSISKKGYFECEVDFFPLAPDSYFLNYSVRVEKDVADKVVNGLALDVVTSNVFNTGKKLSDGIVITPHKWS